VLVTAIFSIATRGSGDDPAATADSQQTATTEMQRHESARRAYPIADYDEPEPSDPSKRAARKEKQKRYNKFPLVMEDPHPKDVEISFIGHPEIYIPALPVEKSDVIVVGDVVTGEAHLSEDKQNVFSVITISVKSVYKAPASTAPAPGALITVERVGGFVRYPNGRTVLYRGAGLGMPRVGRRCVLFLNSIAQSDSYTILTGYELGGKVVEPFDYAERFEAFRGFDVPTFLSTLDDLLTKSSAR
jgi:hypothetical protein